MKKKILFIHHSTGWGGAPNSLIQLIKSLDSSKYQAEVLLIKDSIVSKKLTENGIKFSVASSSFYRKYYFGFIHSEAGYYKVYHIYHILKSLLFWVLSRYYFSSKELSKLTFDIVHLNSSIMSDWLAPSKKRGKVIIHIREPFRKGLFDPFYLLFTGQMRKYADKIIAISHDNADRIGIKSKTEVIYNHTNITKEIPPKDSYYSKRVLYLGGSSYIKGFVTLANALNEIDDDIVVYFAGNYDKYNFSELVKGLFNFTFFSKLKINNAIKVMRSNSKSLEIGLTYEIEKYLKESSCLISPFVKPHFSRPIIESFANRKPVIASDVVGIEEIVKHNVNGIIFKKKDSKQLAQAINYLCNHGVLAEKMGINGLEDAYNKFSSKNISKISEIYDKL